MKKIISIFIVLSFIIVSCSSIAYQRLMKIEMGMKYDEVVGTLDSDRYNDYDINLISNIDSDTYDISKSFNSGDEYKILVTRKYYPKQEDELAPYFIFAFQNEKLIYWGMPIEFNRSDNMVLNTIGAEAVKIIKKNYFVL